MFAQATRLRHWKSEHTEDTCEDVVDGDIAQGLFAIADGAGTTLFADAWANLLVQHFLRVPLLSNDPFETEWWLRMAQEQFKQQSPKLADMSWNAQQKAQNQGSYATLATLRIAMHTTEYAQAELLAIGDSCIFVSRSSSEQLLSFPLQHAEDFDLAPICLPSKPGSFNRYFHQCLATTLELFPDDVIVIATDTVAKWIISSGAGRYSGQKEALQAITRQTAETWADFIQECRAREEMIDDDCTMLMIILCPDSTSTGLALGSTTEHSLPLREQRKQGFIQALNAGNKEQVAIYFGDGRDLQNAGVSISQDDILLARQVADAQREVLAMLRQEANSPNIVATMTPVWQKHAHLLYLEPCAINLRKTLSRLGIPLEPIEPVAPSRLSVAQASAEPAYQNTRDDSDMLHTQIFDMEEIQQLLQSSRQTEEEA